MAATTIYTWEKGNIFIGDDTPDNTNHLVLKSYTSPNLVFGSRDHSGGGAIGDIEFSTGRLNKLEASFVLSGFDQGDIQMFQSPESGNRRITVRGQIRDQRENKLLSMIDVFEADIKSRVIGAFDPANSPDTEYMMTRIGFYKRTLEGKVLHLVDQWNSDLIVNGVNLGLRSKRILGIA